MNSQDRFLQCLEKGRNSRLIIILAGRDSPEAGWLRQWLEQQVNKRTVCLWVDLGWEDNQAVKLAEKLLYMAGGEQQPCETAGRNQRGNIEEMAIELINVLAGQAEVEIYLVLAGYEVITSSASHIFIKFLIDYLPAKAHLFLLSENEPSLNIAHLRVRRQLIEINLNHLS